MALIIMTTEDLEDLEVSVRNFGFKELLTDYSKECPDRLVNLRNYIVSSKYKKLMCHNKYPMSSSLASANRLSISSWVIPRASAHLASLSG